MKSVFRGTVTFRVILPTLLILATATSAQAEVADSTAAAAMSAATIPYTQRSPSLLTNPYRKVFQLFTSPSVISGSAWTSAQVDTFTRAIIDSVAGGGPQIFSTVWDYMCYRDTATARDSVNFVLGGTHYTKIKSYVYYQPDATCPTDYAECNCYGIFFTPNLIYTGVKCSGPVSTPLHAAASGPWGHELAHLADFVNKDPAPVDIRNSELLSTIAEYLQGVRWTETTPPPGNITFDAPLLRCSTYDPYAPYKPYDHFRLFNAYLMQHFSAAADTGDLAYKWIRHKTNNKADTSFRGLGAELNKAPFASQVPGSTSVEKFGNLFQRYAIARYLNNDSYASGLYGFGDVESYGAGQFRSFEWADTNYARARVVPTTLTLGSNLSDGNPDTLQNWIDPQQPWATGSEQSCCIGGKRYRPLHLTTTGSDYLVVLADSTYFTNTGWDRDLSIRIRGVGPRPDANEAFRISYVTYNSYGTPKSVLKSELLGKSIRTVTETVPITMTGDTLDTEVVIPRFGRYNKGVAIVISMVEEDTLNGSMSGGHEMNYKVIYEYKGTYWDGSSVEGSYGVQDSPIKVLTSNFVALSTSLTLAGGTVVEFEKNGTPLALKVRGTLTATNASFTSKETSPAKGDWSGIVIWNSSGSATLKHCTIEYADVGLQFGYGSGSAGGGTADTCSFGQNSDEDVWINSPAAVTVTGGTITASTTTNHVGVHISAGSGARTVRNLEVAGSSSTGTSGILCECAASILGNYVHDFDHGNGIKFDLGDTTIVPTVDDYVLSSVHTPTRLIENSIGIEVAGSARPKIRRARIDNSSYAVRVGTAAVPDLGTSGDHGDCDVTDSSTKHVSCKTPRLSGLPHVSALYNWWGTDVSGDISPKMSSQVDWSPFRATDPYPLMSVPGLALISLDLQPVVRQNSPNPFAKSTRISFRVGKSSERVNIQIFDFAGRLVRHLLGGDLPAGDHDVQWDGQGDNGEALSSGVYYYRVAIGDQFQETRKVLLVH